MLHRIVLLVASSSQRKMILVAAESIQLPQPINLVGEPLQFSDDRCSIFLANRGPHAGITGGDPGDVLPAAADQTARLAADGKLGDQCGHQVWHVADRCQVGIVSRGGALQRSGRRSAARNRSARSSNAAGVGRPRASDDDHLDPSNKPNRWHAGSGFLATRRSDGRRQTWLRAGASSTTASTILPWCCRHR